MTPEKMTNAELAEHMVALSTRSATIEAAKRLRAMPELEIMWRDSAGILYPHSTFLNMQKCGFKDDMQKVEVRVLPCE